MRLDIIEMIHPASSFIDFLLRSVFGAVCFFAQRTIAANKIAFNVCKSEQENDLEGPQGSYRQLIDLIATCLGRGIGNGNR